MSWYLYDRQYLWRKVSDRFFSTVLVIDSLSRCHEYVWQHVCGDLGVDVEDGDLAGAVGDQHAVGHRANGQSGDGRVLN